MSLSKHCSWIPRGSESDGRSVGWLGAGIAVCAIPTSVATAQVWVGPIQLPPAEDRCLENPNGPGCIGTWVGPYTLGATTDNCLGDDDVGHAALLPTGEHAGKVLVWTECDEVVADHRSFIWDAEAGTSAFELATFDGVHLGPFCGGHAWIADEQGDARLVLVGGTDVGTSIDDPCLTGSEVTSEQSNDVSWFNPLLAAPLASAWSAIPDITVHPHLWYPSVLATVDDSVSGPFLTSVLQVGCSSVEGGCCDTLSPNWHVFSDVSNPLSQWSADSAEHNWQEYPRIHYLSSHRAVTTGNDVVCNQLLGSGTEGGNPVRGIDLDEPPYQGHFVGPDPNDASPVIPVGAMHMGNSVLMHTLKPTATWPTTQQLLDLDQLAVDTYDLDRVITYGGTTYEGSFPQNITGVNITSELRASAADPGDWTWKRKADCPTGAVYGSIVVLPDGSVLRVGGQEDTNTPDPLDPSLVITYRFTTEVFYPRQPADAGVWKSLALRSTASSIERGYHSVAGLLPSGAVFLCGGRDDGSPFFPGDPEDTAEVFKPPYFFQGSRPNLNVSPPSPPTLLYGVPFCVNTRHPTQIKYASLIGLCSTTHHFDYSQRYVELLVASNISGLGCTGNENLAIFPPPIETMAPTNYYLLFIVDDKGRPSNGVLVRLSH